MRLVTYAVDGAQRVGAVVDGAVVDLTSILQSLEADAQPMIRLLAGGASALERAHTHIAELQRRDPREAHLALENASLLAPIPRPGKIVAIGRNYADHAAETGGKSSENPRIIAKLPSSVTGPGSVVHRPAGVTKLDYEIELAVVIGKRTKLVSRARALDAVAGYTIINDVSAREFQFDVSPTQTTFAKSMDEFCPMGPWILTADEIADPQNLKLQLHVNGELLQDGNTHDMIFDVAQLIEYISRYMTLEPGDIVSTGTPAGVGAFRKPPRWLLPGDRVRLEIERIGVLEHAIG
jgi:2-keto-4-pentenoate hydratase/2-oxohepta-3-ene-1,7-dioic acid hydratase in catechol pathway